jgi:hypothetical protein
MVVAVAAAAALRFALACWKNCFCGAVRPSSFVPPAAQIFSLRPQFSFSDEHTLFFILLLLL